MPNSIELYSNEIENRIFTIRGLQVMLDRDLAELYGVEVKRLNEQVKRNIARFPDNFRFQLDITEFNELVAICDRFKTLKHSSVRPHAFTEAGVAMLSAVLNTPIAVQVSVRIINAFVAMRKTLTQIGGFIQRLENVELKQLETTQNIDKIFAALESRDVIPKSGVFFEGEVFDAYVLMCQIVKTAQKSIILIDNYVNEATLTIFSKRAENVKVMLFTKEISKQLKLDIEKFNKQYPPIEAKEFDLSHDRFLIVDDKEVYHWGASLKDSGKKWFAFSKMDLDGL
ncbi:MAG: ORF6N domain-containing protein, partial [Chitinivibrionia bacterium]|nr:ORF6N domain-containing protein [Chitinivibrionia bacterium]